MMTWCMPYSASVAISLSNNIILYPKIEWIGRVNNNFHDAIFEQTSWKYSDKVLYHCDFISLNEYAWEFQHNVLGHSLASLFILIW